MFSLLYFFTRLYTVVDEYDIFNKTQKIDSDFDKEVRLLKDKME